MPTWDVPSLIHSQQQHPGGCETPTERFSPTPTGTPKGKSPSVLVVKGPCLILVLKGECAAGFPTILYYPLLSTWFRCVQPTRGCKCRLEIRRTVALIYQLCALYTFVCVFILISVCSPTTEECDEDDMGGAGSSSGQH